MFVDYNYIQISQKMNGMSACDVMNDYKHDNINLLYYKWIC